jgi:hypothetical protein
MAQSIEEKTFRAGIPSLPLEYNLGTTHTQNENNAVRELFVESDVKSTTKASINTVCANLSF